MEKFIHDENIRLYRRLLADAERRRVLLKLLAEEEAKDQRPPERTQAGLSLRAATAPAGLQRGTVRDRAAIAFERKWRLHVDRHAQQDTAI
jgi:hypothetical protein